MKITLKRSNVLEGGVAKEPTSAQMDYGEFAVNYNTVDPSLFIKDSANNIIKVAGQGSVGGKPAGSSSQVQFNDDGAFGSSSSFTYDQGSNTLTAPIGTFVVGNFSDINTPLTSSTTLTSNNVVLEGNTPVLDIPADGTVAGVNGAKILLGNSGTAVKFDNTGIELNENGGNGVKFTYQSGSAAQTYKVPTAMGSQSYALALTDQATGQMGWIGVVPLGQWTEDLIPTLA